MAADNKDKEELNKNTSLEDASKLEWTLRKGSTERVKSEDDIAIFKEQRANIMYMLRRGKFKQALNLVQSL